MRHDHPQSGDAVNFDTGTQIAEQMVDLMLSVLSDGLDHPELWAELPGFVRTQSKLVPLLQHRLTTLSSGDTALELRLLLAICGAALGGTEKMIELVTPLAAEYSHSPLVQGVLFHLKGLLHPQDPRYSLTGKLCPTPFMQMDVLSGATHLCCASWLQTSVGALSGDSDWRGVWNSETAQGIRASIHDGSYRYCNKGTCPMIASNSLIPSGELAARSSFWRDIVETTATEVLQGPEVVNLAYDRTCNLSCPSCRVERYAADQITRNAFAGLQERAILPLLREARTVFITGSGDPFASKNFRQLMRDLTAEDYPNLRFQIMTNGMLLTPAQWESFPSLHQRVEMLKISIDAASASTHERLRRGAKWPTMLENMNFAGRLRAQGQIDAYQLVFTVQHDNYREMGDAVDLARKVGATSIYFGQITNWGTFSSAEYDQKAVFLPHHPDHEDFLKHMSDPRLLDPIVMLSNLQCFTQSESGRHVMPGMAAPPERL